MNYMAPEVLERPYNEKSDIWSLGCIVLDAVTCGFLDVRSRSCFSPALPRKKKKK